MPPERDEEMTSAAVVIAIVVGLGEAKNPSTVALLSAARQSLAEGATVRLVEKAAPNQVDAESLERDLGADATVVVTWRDVDRQHALVRVHFSVSDRWFAQQIDFAPADTTTERGRTLGLAAASIWPDPGRARRPPQAGAASAPRPAATPAARPAAAGPRVASTDSAVDGDRAVAHSGGQSLSPPPEMTLSERWVQEPRANPRPAAEGEAPTSRREGAGEVELPPARGASLAPDSGSPHSYALELDGVVAAGLGHPADGLGAAVRGTFFPVSLGLGLCAGIGVRTGRLAIAAPAQGREVEAQLALGLEWWPQDGRLRTGIDESPEVWALGLRLQALAVYHDVFDPRGESRALILPGGELAARVRFRLASRLHVLAGAAIEGLAGEVVIRRPGGDPAMTPVEVARIASLRAVGELGIRVTF
jgi:hypothetical protein